MDVPRKDARRKKLIKRILIGLVLLAAIPAITVALSRLKPAAPGVEMSTLWPDTVKRGPMLREVRGLGTLVPEDTLLIPATTDGRVQRILVYPGTPVKADTVVMILTSPELETATLDAEEAQLAAQTLKVEQLRAQLSLKKSQLAQLKVTAGFDGMLQQHPTPVEVGQKVVAGTPLGKVAQPSKLKAELKIAETQVKDIVIGQPATIDTRNGLIEGRVSRIYPSILNGTVTVDVALKGPLPAAARPDLSVDGTIQLEKL